MRLCLGLWTLQEKKSWIETSQEELLEHFPQFFDVQILHQAV